MKKRAKWMPTIQSNEWVQPTRKGYQMGCCDCGLVHTLNFRLVPYGNGKHKIQFQVTRNESATKRLRKRDGIKVKRVEAPTDD